MEGHLGGFHLLQEVNGELTLKDNGHTENMSLPSWQLYAFQALREVQRLTVDGTRLASLTEPFPAIKVVRKDLVIKGNAELTIFRAFDKLQSAGTIQITGHPILSKCSHASV